MPRSLADGRTKFTILTDEPADPAAPTITELNAGIDASDRILASDFMFGAGDSDNVSEKSLAATNNANALGASNYSLAFTVFRFFDTTTKNAHATEDDVWSAVKVKGTELWVYARRNGKLSSAAWAASDEIFLGAEAVTDIPQPPGDAGGYIKWRVPCEVQDAYPNILAAAGA
jgi:hypothetical protein